MKTDWSENHSAETPLLHAFAQYHSILVIERLHPWAHSVLDRMGAQDTFPAALRVSPEPGQVPLTYGPGV